LPLLNVERLSVAYGEVPCLWEVSLEVDKGEIVTVIGPNGAGKTTLLKTIAGLLSPLNGHITFEGKEIERLRPHQRVELGISLVPEGRGIFPFMTVKDNLELGAYTRRAERYKKESLEFVYNLFPRLREREKQLAGTLSGGEQQMLAIGRALMSRPKLLMLDEPSLGLAPKLVIEIFQSIKRLNEEGVTVLLVEQNVHYSLKLASRGYVLESGRIILSGSSGELLDNEHVKRAYLGV